MVADMSSNFISRRVQISDYAVIFGGAQKNIGTKSRSHSLGQSLSPEICLRIFHSQESFRSGIPPCVGNTDSKILI